VFNHLLNGFLAHIERSLFNADVACSSPNFRPRLWLPTGEKQLFER
jgi:hypothetical protein